MFHHSGSVISVRVSISPTGDIITHKVILRKTGDRQTDDRKTANRKTGNKTGDKKILNKTDDIKTQKCFRHSDSVISVRVRISPTGDIITYKMILRKTGDRQTDDRKTANRKTDDKKILKKLTT